MGADLLSLQVRSGGAWQWQLAGPVGAGRSATRAHSCTGAAGDAAQSLGSSGGRSGGARLPATCLQPPLCAHTSLIAFLQGNIKRDPPGYEDEFQLQWRHYQACLQLFLLKPAQDGGEFADLVNFIAQVRLASR